MKKRKKKIRKLRRAAVHLHPVNYPTLAGFRLIERNVNQLWKWDTLEDVKF